MGKFFSDFFLPPIVPNVADEHCEPFGRKKKYNFFLCEKCAVVLVSQGSCGPAASDPQTGETHFAPKKLLTNAKKVTVSVLYWYEKLSSPSD